MKILVADDVDDNLDLMRRLLTRRGHEVVVARNGAEAVAVYTEAQPHLIFMDVSMPVMSGMDAVREIRAGEPEGRRTPIVAVTAHAMVNERASFIEAGCDGVITKPIEFDQIYAALERFSGAAPAEGIVR